MYDQRCNIRWLQVCRLQTRTRKLQGRFISDNRNCSMTSRLSSSQQRPPRRCCCSGRRLSTPARSPNQSFPLFACFSRRIPIKCHCPSPCSPTLRVLLGKPLLLWFNIAFDYVYQLCHCVGGGYRRFSHDIHRHRARFIWKPL